MGMVRVTCRSATAAAVPSAIRRSGLKLTNSLASACICSVSQLVLCGAPRWTAAPDVGPSGVRSSDHVSLAVARPPSVDRSLCCFPFREQ